MFTPGNPGSAGDGTTIAGIGGLGAYGNEMVTYWGISVFSGAPGGVGGKGANQQQGQAASPGTIFILEFSA
jgi:hypothetical protein